MNTNIKSQNRKGEQGNVLFLILIAVALFAALSYAVTQSTRSGGGDASSEKSLVSSAALTQYPASLKTAIVRMTVSNGIDPTTLLFNTPSTFSALNTATLQSEGVFYPTGGGATYTKAAAGTTTASGDWVFNGNNSVYNIGTTAATPDAATADIMAILPDVTKGICDKIHSQLGISGAYETYALNLQNMDTTLPGLVSGSPAGKVIGDLSGTSPLRGQPQGCVLLSANRYAYFHVLVER